MRPPLVHTAHVQAALADHASPPVAFTNDLTRYAQFFMGHPLVAEAMGYSNLPQGVRDAIWAAFDAAESAVDGLVPDIGRPAAYPVDVFDAEAPAAPSLALTVNEATDCYATHCAHKIKSDLDNLFPWKLAQYELGWLVLLFDPDDIFIPPWTNGTTASFARVALYSIRKGYDIAVANGFLKSTQKETIFAWCEWLFANGFHHYGTGDALHVLDIEHVIVDWVSRGGCHGSSLTQRAFSHALNIPQDYVRAGQSCWAGGGHNTAAYPFADVVMLHGDNLYDGYFGVPSPDGEDPYPRRFCFYGTYDHFVNMRDVLTEQQQEALTWDVLLRDFIRGTDRPVPGDTINKMRNPDEGWGVALGNAPLNGNLTANEIETFRIELEQMYGISGWH